MASGSSTGAVDQQVCWEQINRTAHPFRFTRIFAGRDAEDRLLAVYSFCAVFERMACESQDEEVAMRKLEWWRFQCIHQGMRDSKHPVLRELVRTSASERLEKAQLSSMMDLAAQRIEARPISDRSELRSLARQLGNAQLQIEAAAFGRPVQRNVEAMGFAQLIRESISPDSANPFWWLPMNLLAAHGLSRAEITAPSKSQKFQELSAELLEFLDEDESVQNSAPASSHACLIDHLNRRQLARSRGKALDALISELNRLRTSDVVSLWRRARSLR